MFEEDTQDVGGEEPDDASQEPETPIETLKDKVEAAKQKVDTKAEGGAESEAPEETPGGEEAAKPSGGILGGLGAKLKDLKDNPEKLKDVAEKLKDLRGDSGKRAA